MVPANNAKLHYTVFYLINVSQEEISQAKQLYYQLVTSLIPKDQNGRYMCDYHSRKPWHSRGNSVILDGEIAIFKKKVNDLMKQYFPGRVSYRESHVNVHGKFDVFLYPSFNMMQISESIVQSR